MRARDQQHVWRAVERSPEQDEPVTVQGVPEAPTVSAVPENAGGGVNASEASDGTTVTVALPDGSRVIGVSASR